MPTGGILDFGAGKTFLCGPLTLLPNRTYTGSSTLKLRDAVNGTFITMADSVTLSGLTIDGNRANQSSAAYATALLRALTKDNIILSGLTIQNAHNNGVYANQCLYFTMQGCIVTGMNGEAVFLHRGCSYALVEGNTFTDLLDDGIKVHTTDNLVPDATLIGVQVKDNVIDYRGSTMAVDTIAIEIFTGGNRPDASSSGHLVSGNTIYGNSGGVGIFGVSFDVSDDSVADGNVVIGPGVKYGYENAGGQNVTFSNNEVSGYDLLGITVSQSRHSNTTIEGCTIRGATSVNGVCGIQFYNGGPVGIVRNCVLIDAGDRAIFYNGSGGHGEVTNCTFETVDQADNMVSVYVYQEDDIAIIDNTGTSGNGNVLAPVNNGGVNITQSGNAWN